MSTKVIALPAIESSFQGFASLIELAAQLEGLKYTKISLDLHAANWFAASMCAPFGALLYKAGRRLNSVHIVNIPPRVENILTKNNFLSNYGRPKKVASRNTAIQYNRFERKDDRYFGAYLERHLKSHAIPNMSPGLRKKLWESIFEIFSNAVLHSETELGIFACGQHFPRKSRLDFSIADLGIGIKYNLQERLDLQLAADKAIEWAIAGRNTTKTGPIPGGLGLKLLREFSRLNHGHLQIVSDRGYWEQLPDGNVQTHTFRHAFPGTVVNIEINTADPSSYRLGPEPSSESVF